MAAVGVLLMVGHVVLVAMTKELTGICERCNKQKPTKFVADDWAYRLVWHESCYDCMKDE